MCGSCLIVKYLNGGKKSNGSDCCACDKLIILPLFCLYSAFFYLLLTVVSGLDLFTVVGNCGVEVDVN